MSGWQDLLTDGQLLLAIVQDGAACCIVANGAFVRANKLENQAIELVATGLGTDSPDTFAGRSAMDSVGYGMTRRLADKVFAQAGANRDDIGVIELHDCFAANEVCVILRARDKRQRLTLFGSS